MLFIASVSLGPARTILRNPRHTFFIVNDLWSLVETSHPYYEKYMNQAKNERNILITA